MRMCQLACWWGCWRWLRSRQQLRTLLAVRSASALVHTPALMKR